MFLSTGYDRIYKKGGITVIIDRAFLFDNAARSSYKGTYVEPEICPACHHAVKPQELSVHEYKIDQQIWGLSFTYLCQHCYQPFLVFHKCTLARLVNAPPQYKAQLCFIEPQRFTEQDFDDQVKALSPCFVKIYNQALAAEASALDEIAGLGYRKAMEFLVKDFCIHKHPNDSEKIKALPLGQCIDAYIDTPEIKALATKTAWIGNDEAHYIRKQEDRDIHDMKAFIKALVYFIGMVLIYEDADSMTPVK